MHICVYKHSELEIFRFQHIFPFQQCPALHCLAGQLFQFTHRPNDSWLGCEKWLSRQGSLSSFATQCCGKAKISFFIFTCTGPLCLYPNPNESFKKSFSQCTTAFSYACCDPLCMCMQVRRSIHAHVWSWVLRIQKLVFLKIEGFFFKNIGRMVLPLGCSASVRGWLVTGTDWIANTPCVTPRSPPFWSSNAVASSCTNQRIDGTNKQKRARRKETRWTSVCACCGRAGQRVQATQTFMDASVLITLCIREVKAWFWLIAAYKLARR